jgi:hypothetical protein
MRISLRASVRLCRDDTAMLVVDLCLLAVSAALHARLKNFYRLD